MEFGLLPSYCGVWFIRLLRHGAFCHLVKLLYLCGSDSNKQKRIQSDYGPQNIEELES